MVTIFVNPLKLQHKTPPLLKLSKFLRLPKFPNSAAAEGLARKLHLVGVLLFFWRQD